MNPVYTPEYYEFLYEKSSRNRILVTARTLFASLGYDNTSTALIARNAGTSESQLMKHFGGKAGLLETIFTEGWDKINAHLMECFGSANDFNAKLSCIPGVVSQYLDKDLELKTLVLLEGHRMRDVARRNGLQSGYARFLQLIDEVIGKAAETGELPESASKLCVRSAVVGIVEGGIREQVLASRANFPANYTTEEFTKVVSGFLRSVAGAEGERICAR
ncbi:MAG TPA: TetR/AcrR family transcriptional regulator [Bryobacteraceae bacterium]|nr:TetR/AcrR family transcriptional regulator [Bryobacteraceae bacterium]